MSSPREPPSTTLLGNPSHRESDFDTSNESLEGASIQTTLIKAPQTGTTELAAMHQAISPRVYDESNDTSGSSSEDP